MADPATPFPERESPVNGVGPYDFDLADFHGDTTLSPGEVAVLNLRTRQNGRYVALTEEGFDSVEVTNLDSTESLRVGVNGAETSFRVPPNVTTSYGTRGMYAWHVENIGSADIDAADVTVEVDQSPYGADDRAREERTRSPVAAAVENLTGVPIGR